MPAASTARPVWAPTCGSRSRTSSASRQRSSRAPYIHHCVAIHANVVPVLYEACKYIGIQPDLYDPIEEDVKAYLRGE